MERSDKNIIDAKVKTSLKLSFKTRKIGLKYLKKYKLSAKKKKQS